MNENIYNKILELWNLVKEVPQECKGNSEEASKNRRTWMHIRSTIHQLLPIIQLIREEDE